jgi:GT2 family glycosyltransferase
MAQALTVIVVNWNTRELLRRCLLSVRRTRVTADAQVIVVDNASSDGSAEMVRAELPWVELIANDRNVGFGVANNQALPRARGRDVLLLNPDAELRDGALEPAIRYLAEHPEAGVVGTTLVHADGSLQLYCNRYPGAWHSLRHNQYVARLLNERGLSCSQRLGQARGVDWVLGACLLVRRRILEQVGAFDPRFFVYGEEIDLQYRIRQAGWDVVYVPSPGVVHHSGQSTRKIGAAASLHEIRGRLLFARKHYSRLTSDTHLAKALTGVLVGLTYWGALSLTPARAVAGQQLRSYGRLLAWYLGGCPTPPVPTLTTAAAARG